MTRKVYMVCDWSDDKAMNIQGTPNIGVEFLGNCHGRILEEDGALIGFHYSSTLDFLRSDLRRKLTDPESCEIIDLIGQGVPERFKEATP